MFVDCSVRTEYANGTTDYYPKFVDRRALKIPFEQRSIYHVNLAGCAIWISVTFENGLQYVNCMLVFSLLMVVTLTGGVNPSLDRHLTVYVVVDDDCNFSLMTLWWMRNKY